MLKFRIGKFVMLLLSIVFLIKFGFAQTASSRSASAFHGVAAAKLGDTFPLLKIADCDHQGPVYLSAEFDIDIHYATLNIHGRDRSGNAWSAQTSFNGLGCEMFQADLDGNGQPDLVILTPGIGSRGAYDTNLTLLLFDAAGKPVPWSATGLFRVNPQGISEIIRTSSGEAVILHTHLSGLRAWGGFSSISQLYKISDAQVSPIKGSYFGIQFPRISGARATDQTFRTAMGRMNLSTVSSVQSTASGAPASRPRFVRYGTDIPSATVQQSSAPLTADQGTRITIDTNALNGAAKHIILSDGSQSELPAILIVDAANGAHKIIFSPDSQDINQLGKGSYSIEYAGTDCQDASDCQPFILRAIQE